MNKTLWIYWEQGFENAPEIVTKCVRSWQYHNRDFKIVLLDKRNLENYIDVERPMQAIQAWSDIVRINLLKEYGGFWVDATVACNMSIEDWIPKYAKEGFFGFYKPNPSVEIASWFLYGEKGNRIIETWKEAVDDYWKNPDFKGYLWFHMLFHKRVLKDPLCKDMWIKVKKWNANHEPFPEGPQNPHYFTPYQLDRWKRCNEELTAPCYKLAHGISKHIMNEPNIMRIFNESK